MNRSNRLLPPRQEIGAPISGLKVLAKHGGFALGPSAIEDICKGQNHLNRILEEARTIVSDALAESVETS